MDKGRHSVDSHEALRREIAETKAIATSARRNSRLIVVLLVGVPLALFVVGLLINLLTYFL